MRIRWFAREPAAGHLRHCPVCDASGRRLRVIGTIPTTGSIVFERDRYELVECGGCQLIFLSPQPSDEDLRRIYLQSSQFDDALYVDRARVDAILEYMTSCLTRILARSRRSADARVSVLEVGAGLAWMGRAAKALNPQSATTAQDISAEAVDQCPWIDRYVHGDAFDARLDARAPYDVVSMTHVIEHLVDPLTVVRRCAGLLAAGGVILVTAPHRPVGWRSGSSDLSLWRNYSYTHVPAHIQYFSRRSMLTFARKAGCELAYWNADGEDGQAFEAWLCSSGDRRRASADAALVARR